MFLFLVVLFALIQFSSCAMHRSGGRGPVQVPGSGKESFWRLPGFARPVWIVDREFHATETSPARKDRMYVKLNPDNSVKVISARKRPWLQWLKPKPKSMHADLEGSLYDTDGYWKADDESNENPLFNTYKLVFEVNEGLEKGRTRYESRCTWGRMDGYAAFFRQGKMYKYKGSQNGTDIRIGEYEIGNIMIRSNVQRPLISKDFLAFQ